MSVSLFHSVFISYIMSVSPLVFSKSCFKIITFLAAFACLVCKMTRDSYCHRSDAFHQKIPWSCSSSRMSYLFVKWPAILIATGNMHSLNRFHHNLASPFQEVALLSTRFAKSLGISTARVCVGDFLLFVCLWLLCRSLSILHIFCASVVSFGQSWKLLIVDLCL